ncbi:hypothetical protein BGL34_03105 [Fructilactobacillus lindneri]|nr:NAD(P)-binding oxidoreductase [Fructilactobacillus lindneri]ANZ57879.1 hypothetical protein AYR60_03425 [Fructilactobacillus lindneri]ANZ59148.1 hypothetical protein AYR59_03425 [Fructilactobacillus lindneri]POG98199.1 hypothetical protein BGL31_03755 [Fructilactobacillus lindneri]POH01684.1 hypothetical protein BGL32_03675 [Fructilactobacillus lindneri]POH03527.1 hypothetical protein BGL33_02560 [Fructilactobacillus lindneri]
MKIMIIGGSGRVGTALTEDFVKNTNDEITVAVGHPEKATQFKDLPNVNVIKFDFANLKIEQITAMLKGYDAIYFVAGSRGKSPVQVDSFGAIKTMIAAQKAGVSRYIMLSSFGALQPDQWIGNPKYASLQAYQAAKFMADHYLIHDTDLNYTILQPSSLTEKTGTGKVALNEDEKSTENPIPDVAEVLFQILNNKNTYKKVILMHSGATPIKSALDNLK